MIDNRRIFAAAAVFAAAVVGLTCGLSSQAGAGAVSLANPYIGVSLGTAGTIPGPGEDEWQSSGRWAVVTYEGDPETSGDNDRGLIYGATYGPAENYGFFKIKIGENIYLIGDDSSGYWEQSPVAYPVPPPGLGLGTTGGFIQGEWVVTATEGAEISVLINAALVRDQARFAITITNQGTTAQSVGFGMFGDVEVANSTTIATPFVPGIGVVESPLAPARCFGSEFDAGEVPDYFEIFDDIANPAMVTRNTLNLADCVIPDHVLIGEDADLSALALWDMWLADGYDPSVMDEVDNFAWLLTWKGKTLLAGQSRKIVTYYGVGAATSAWTYSEGNTVKRDRAVLAVQGPRSLKYDSDPLHGAANDLLPDPFTIQAYVYNLATDDGPYVLEDATAYLFLPPGLELAAGYTAQQDIGEVPKNSEGGPAVWEVVPTGEYCGELKYYVSVTDITGWSQTVERTIMVPATKRSVFRYGWQLMHVPFDFNNRQIDHVFGLNLGTFGARYWDPVSGAYLPVEQVEPGQGFWMFVGGMQFGDTQPTQVAADAAIVGEDFGKQVEEQYIPLKTGWNMMGNPFVYPIYWGQVLVYNPAEPTTGTLSLDEAVARRWISKTAFAWSPAQWSYMHFSDNDSLLLPWQGYWVYARKNVTLVMRPAAFPESEVTAQIGGY